MLYRYLSWFESEPVGALLPYDGEAMSNFVTLGALSDIQRTRQITCLDCGHEFALQLFMWQERDVKCVACGGRVKFTTEYMSTQIKLDWLAQVLTRRLGGPDELPHTLVESRLWRLANAATSAGDVPVYLFRAGWHVPLPPIVSKLQEESTGRQIVLSSSPLINEKLADTNRTIFAIDEVARMETEGVWLDLRRLGDALTAPYPLWFDLDPSNDRLTIGTEVLVLRRNQKEFMRLLAAAHESGHPSVNWKNLMRQARYDANYTSLTQAFPPELFRFIDTAKGDVWIRKEALPRARAGPSPTYKDESNDDNH